MTCPACAAEIPAGFKFCGNCGHKLESPAAPAPPRVPETSTRRAGERREIAVLFADVSGFTALSEKLDPEDVHALMNEVFAGLDRAIHEQGGHVHKHIGDNVMGLFGAPVAHEDDPARACRAALDMQEFLSRFTEECARRTGVRLRMRVGIHAGLVVAAGVGSDVRMEFDVMGDTVNLASRLESAAPPGGILVSSEVVRRTRGGFDFGPSRTLSVKGKEIPVETFELRGVAGEADSRGRDGLSAELIGRESEVKALESWWRGGAESRWFEVRGDLGIGKTRLVEEASRRLADLRPFTVVATPDTGRVPFGLARRLVLSAADRLGSGRAKLETRDAFAAALAPLGEGLAPFLDALWHLCAPSRLAVPAPDPDPQTLRRTVEHGVAALLRGLSDREPGTALVMDSYELADSATGALFGSLRADSRGLPLPVVVTIRDEAGTGEAGKGIRLGRLPGEASGELLKRLVRGAGVPETLRRDLVERAAGVPLFLEEMVRAWVDEKALVPEADGRWRWAGGAGTGSAALPASIRAAMVARLDRLAPEESEFLRSCAVQGTEFDAAVAEDVRGKGPDAAPLLEALRRRGLLADMGEGRWTFRQPLLHEACYETLLLRDRRAVHGETAETFCRRAGGEDRVAPHLLAFHYERAERWTPAAKANLRAGDRAAELFVNAEAIRRYEQALELLRRGEKDAHLEARVLAGAAQVRLRTGDYARAEANARAMASVADRPADRGEAARLAAAACLHTGKTEEGERLLAGAIRETGSDPGSREILNRALYDLADHQLRANRPGEAMRSLAESRAAAPPGDLPAAVRADMLEGRIAHAEGRFSDAERLYARAFEEAERVGSLSDRARAANNLGNAARDRGDYEGARNHFERALETWTRTGDEECIAGAHNNLGNLAMSQGEFDRARDHQERSLTTCRRISNVHGAALAHANLAILAMEQDDGRSAREAAEGALEALGETGNALLRWLVRVVLGEALLASGDVDGAARVFEEVVRDCDGAAHPLALAGAWRGRGRVALERGAWSAARADLDRALEAFEKLERAQEAARTALYRAEVLWREGDRDTARAELRRARERFVGMRAARDAERAERLLRELTG